MHPVLRQALLERKEQYPECTAADMNPTPRLNSSLTFVVWNDTIWNIGTENLNTSSSQQDEEDEEDNGHSYPTSSTLALFVTVFAFFLVT